MWSRAAVHALDRSVPGRDCAALAGMSLKNLSAVLKCMGSEDVMTLKADDDGDKLCLMFENPGGCQITAYTMSELVSAGRWRMPMPGSAWVGEPVFLQAPILC